MYYSSFCNFSCTLFPFWLPLAVFFSLSVSPFPLFSVWLSFYPPLIFLTFLSISLLHLLTVFFKKVYDEADDQVGPVLWIRVMTQIEGIVSQCIHRLRPPIHYDASTILYLDAPFFSTYPI